MTALLPATLSLALAPPAAPAKPGERVVLLDLDTTMVGMASQVTAALRNAGAREKINVVPADEIRTKLYYYAMFDIDPPRPDKCVGFYSYMEFSLNHLFKLKRHRSLLESIGI